VAPAGNAELLAAIKQRVQTSRVRAAVAVNRELLLLYFAFISWGGQVMGPAAPREADRPIGQTLSDHSC
jgi:hypothetical protein